MLARFGSFASHKIPTKLNRIAIPLPSVYYDGCVNALPRTLFADQALLGQRRDGGTVAQNGVSVVSNKPLRPTSSPDRSLDRHQLLEQAS